MHKTPLVHHCELIVHKQEEQMDEKGNNIRSAENALVILISDDTVKWVVARSKYLWVCSLTERAKNSDLKEVEHGKVSNVTLLISVDIPEIS